jgi:hypothetical protein
MSFQPITAAQILDRLANQKPAPPLALKNIRAQVRLRWAATAFTALLLPFSLFVAFTMHTWAWVVLCTVVALLASAGLIALGVAWGASRKSASLADWGMKPLSEDEIETFIELVDRHPAIQRVLSDTWMSAWIEQGHSLLGRDLAFLQRNVSEYEVVLARHPEQASHAYPITQASG